MDKKSEGRCQSDMQLRQIAYRERKKIKDVVDEALGSYLKGRKSGS